MDKIPGFSSQPELKNPTLIVGWATDVGKIGSKVIDYLVARLGGESFYEIDPAEYFSLNGVAVEDDVMQFPEGKFYACPKSDLLLLKSYPPNLEWYKFLTLVLDISEHFHVKELHVLGAMISSAAHTTPRRIMGTCNSIETKDALSAYDIINELTFQTSSGQKPTLNSFLLWESQKRKIPGVSLWVPMPFYLVNAGDLLGQKIVLEFLNQRCNLGLNTDDLDEAVRRQNVKIAELRNKNPLINGYINKLEANLSLTDDESQSLIYEIESCLKE